MLTRAGDFQFDSQGRLIDQSGQQVWEVTGNQFASIDLPYAVGRGTHHPGRERMGVDAG